ncbi:MAG: hypothetical protein GY774_16650 [Planctomycetes bacterium]|nr:hypothetical protein [Planctomycetota bacterium]
MRLLEQLANKMSERKKLAIMVKYKTTKGKNKELEAEYDTLFSTVDLGSAIVPVRELKDWLRTTCRAEVSTIVIKMAEAQPQN